MASLRERLELSADPIAARKLLESEQRRPTRRGGRRVCGRLVPPGGETYAQWLERNGYAGMDRQV